MSTKNQPAAEGVVTSGHHATIWTDTIKPLKYETLNKDIKTDVVVVGGGLGGLTVAYRLSKLGKKVVVVEDGYLGSGETGRTTAHIVNALDDRYFEIQKMHGKEAAVLAADSHTAAIDLVANIVHDEKIDCEFKRVDGYLFPHATDTRKTIDDEFIATRESGITTELLESVPGIVGETGPSLKFPNQAQFHPLKYLQGLADAIIKNGGDIYTESRADEITKEGIKVKGFHVSAQHIVVATNTPINDWVTMHTKQFPYRTYVIAVAIPKGSVKPALWWDTGDHKSKWVGMPYHYVRVEAYNEINDLLIVGGADHKTGQADKEDMPEEERYFGLKAWASKRFPMISEVVYKWSGQIMESVDAMAFIGKNPGDDNIYIVTGDSGNGMTHCTIAGILIPDLIMGKENPWTDLYDPSRLMFSAMGNFLSEVGNMAAQYVDLITPGDLKSADELKPGNGAVIRKGLKKIAVYKNDNGKLLAFSAICPHLGCVLQWNNDEKSFDCPCHGSRFTYEGKLVNGPAVADLKQISFKK